MAAGLLPASQLEVLHVTEPGVPDAPAATPHFLAHPDGSPRTQLPGIRKRRGIETLTGGRLDVYRVWHLARCSAEGVTNYYEYFGGK